jgi:hypothetical protein
VIRSRGVAAAAAGLSVALKSSDRGKRQRGLLSSRDNSDRNWHVEALSIDKRPSIERKNDLLSVGWKKSHGAPLELFSTRRNLILTAGRAAALPAAVGIYVACWTKRLWTEQMCPAGRGTRI